MRIVSKQMFQDHMAAIAADYDYEFKTEFDLEKNVFLHGSDEAWKVRSFDRGQGNVYLYCERTGEEGFFRWEAIRDIDPF